MFKSTETNIIFTMEGFEKVDDLPWNNHATFPGVYLKHLVKGAQTDGKFSCHLVKVEAGCELSQHIHAGNWEIHEVVGGNTKGYLDGAEMAYVPGTIAVIPAGRQHRVAAGSEELLIRATFVPALV